MSNQRHHRVLSTSTCDLEECLTLRPYAMSTHRVFPMVMPKNSLDSEYMEGVENTLQCSTINKVSVLF